MKNYLGLILCLCVLLLQYSCKKVFLKDESLPLTRVSVKTVLKDHTAGLDYKISGLLEVNAEWIIEAGVEIGMESGAEIVITDSAVVHAGGTDAKPVVFRPVDEGATWAGISVRSTATSTFRSVRVEGATNRGWGRGAVEVFSNANLEMENTAISGSGGASALAVDAGGTCVLKSGCNFHFNFSPFQLDLGSELTVSGGTFTGNTKDVIYLKNRNEGSIFIRDNRVLKKQILPYLTSGNIYVLDGTLEIEAGVNVQFVQGSGIFCSDYGSRLNLMGTSAKPIILENDKSEWKPKSPTWIGIVVSAGFAVFRGTTFSDVTHPYQGAVTVQGIGDLNMTGCTMKNYIGKCSILKVGNMSKVNGNIATANSYLKSPGFCSL
jgi:hypothetical protein